jgi:hypothetical protein
MVPAGVGDDLVDEIGSDHQHLARVRDTAVRRGPRDDRRRAGDRRSGVGADDPPVDRAHAERQSSAVGAPYGDGGVRTPSGAANCGQNDAQGSRRPVHSHTLASAPPSATLRTSAKYGATSSGPEPT